MPESKTTCLFGDACISYCLFNCFLKNNCIIQVMYSLYSLSWGSKYFINKKNILPPHSYFALKYFFNRLRQIYRIKTIFQIFRMYSHVFILPYF